MSYVTSTQPPGSASLSEAAQPGTFLSMLAPSLRRQLVAHGRVLRFLARRDIVRQRVPVAEVFLVLDGWAKLSVLGEGGRVVVTGVAGPGSAIGDRGALTGSASRETATALESLTAVAVAVSDFRQLIGGSAPAAVALARSLEARLQSVNHALAERATADATGRVAALLAELADRHGTPVQQGIRLEVPLTREEVASWVGATRETVSRVLRVLRDAGWIDASGRTLIVRDIAALHRRSSNGAG